MAQLTGTNGLCRRELELVDQVGDELFARARLAGDEHAAVAVGNDPHEVEHRAHPGAAADDDVVDGVGRVVGIRQADEVSRKPGPESLYYTRRMRLPHDPP